MSGVIGALQTPQTIPNAALPVQGVPGSRATFYLRSTPKVFTLLATGQSNQDFQIAAVQAVDVPQVLRDSRLSFYNPPRVDFPLYKSGTAVAGLVGSGTDAATHAETGTGIASFRGSGSSDTGEVAFTPLGLYASLLEADRPVAWWGLNYDEETVDSSGHGYTLTSVGTQTMTGSLLTHGQKLQDASRDFDGSADAAYTLGTLYASPAGPPAYHSATAGAGSSSADLTIVSPPGIEAGDLLVACIIHATQTATISAAPSGWTQVGSTVNAGTHALAVYKRLPSSDEPPDEHKWTWSTSGSTLGAILAYRNCDQDVSGLIYDSGLQVTSSASFHSTTTETNPIQSKALALWTGDFTGTISPDPTGVKTRTDISNSVSPALKIVAAEYDVTAAGSLAKVASTSASTTLGAVLLTFGAPEDVLEDALDAISEDISLHALIHPDTVAAGTRTIVRKQDSWGLHLNGATVEFVYKDGGGTDRTVTGPTVSASATTHLVVVDDGTDIHFYKNGAETTSSRLGAAGYTTNANRVTVGAYYDGSYSNYWDGRLDEVAVFAAPVSDQMVDAWYEAHSAGTFGTQLLGTAGAGKLPRVKLEMAFASSPTDSTLVWEDVTADLRASEVLSPTRGRNFELDRVEVGRMDFMLSNRNRQYDDTYASSPYYPNVVPTRPVRLRAQAATDGIAYEVFFGYTEGHPLLRAEAGLDSVARFTATDAFKALSLDKVQGAFVRPQELSGARLAALLDGFPGIPFAGDAGQSEVVGDDLNGMNSLDHAQQVAETEGGVLFADRHGQVMFQDRHHRVRNERTVRATYGDGGGSELPLRHMEPMLDESRLFTSAAVTPSSGNVMRAVDPAQALAHFVRTKEITTLHTSDNDAQAMAEAFAYRYATPRTRIPRITVQPQAHSDPPTMWAVVLGHELSHRIRTVERPIGDTSAVTRDHFIEGITHQITGDNWVVSFSVSPAELEGEYWLLGQGELGDTSGLTATVLGW